MPAQSSQSDGQECPTSETSLNFAQNQRGELRTSEVAMQLTTGGGKPGEGYSAVLQVLTSGPAASPARTSRSLASAPDSLEPGVASPSPSWPLWGVAYRVLDAQFFGVPQRRRRVFILGLRSGADDPDGHLASERAATVLAVGSRCARHPATGQQPGPEPAAGTRGGVGHTLSTRPGQRLEAEGDYIASSFTTGPTAGRNLESNAELVATLRVGGRSQGAGSSYDNTPWTVAGLIRSHVRPGSNSLRGLRRCRSPRRESLGDQISRESHLVSTSPDPDRMRTPSGMAGRLDLDPEGIDSARYRVIGNGVAAPVAEWIGRRLA